MEERQKAEADLRLSEERYRSLVLATTSIVFNTDANGFFTTPQASWEAYTGQEWEEHLNWGGMKMLHPDDLDSVKSAWGGAVDKRVPFDREERIWHAASQQYRWCRVRAVPLLDADGTVREWIGTVVDIHAEKERQTILEALQSERERLAAVIAAMPAGVILLNASAELVMANREAAHMYGVPDLMAVPQEQIETWKVYRPDGHLLSREEYPVARTLATGEVVHNEEFLLERWDGTRIPILANTAPLRDPSGTVLAAILIFTDISRLKEVETALQESNTRLRLGILETHDRVRNNLQIINAMLELSIDDADGTLPAADAKRLSRQILTLASVHNILTNEARFDRFGYDISSHTLLENLLPALDMEDMTGSVSCISDITDIPLSIPQATSLALVVNELMSNAVKQGGKHFEVTFAIADQEPGGESQPTSDPLIPPLAILQIREAGSDLPADFSFDTAAPTGLNIEQIVRFNLRGTLQITRHQDTASIEARVIFPLKFI